MPINLAEIEEWLCDTATVIEGEESQRKFAEAAQCVHQGREFLFQYTALVTSQPYKKEIMDLIGPQMFSPDALEKRDGPGIPKVIANEAMKHKIPDDWQPDTVGKENINAQYGKYARVPVRSFETMTYKELQEAYPDAVAMMEGYKPFSKKVYWLGTIAGTFAGFLLHGALIGFHVITW